MDLSSLFLLDDNILTFGALILLEFVYGICYKVYDIKVDLYNIAHDLRTYVVQYSVEQTSIVQFGETITINLKLGVLLVVGHKPTQILGALLFSQLTLLAIDKLPDLMT